MKKIKVEEVKEQKEHVPLHIKYRPKRFIDFVGNESVVNSILDSMGRPHMYLLYGMRGCGKTTLARLIMDKLGVNSQFDLYEIDAASARGIDAAKQLKALVPLKPLKGKRKGFIIDECHRLTAEAQDTWLKTLEEPPPHAFFVFCTTDFDKVLMTIKSRAAKYHLKPLTRQQTLDLLRDTVKTEELEIQPQVIRDIADISEGVPREALVMLEQVRDMSVKEALTFLEEGTAEDSTVRDIVNILLDKRTNKWKELSPILRHLPQEPEMIRRGILSYLKVIALKNPKTNKTVCQLAELFMENVFDSGKEGLIFLVMRACLMRE